MFSIDHECSGNNCVDFREYRIRIIGYKKGNNVHRPSAYHNYSLHYSACVNNNADVMHALVAMGGRGQRME